MTDKPSGLRRLWNRLSGKHPLENRDGTVTTRHGRHIIPYRTHLRRDGGLDSNLRDVLAQPRLRELMRQMRPLLTAPAGDKFVLDETTGDFFLKSDVQKHGAAKAKPLGQIDVAAEKDLFILAGEEIFIDRAFGPAAARRRGPANDSMTAAPTRKPRPNTRRGR